MRGFVRCEWPAMREDTTEMEERTIPELLRKKKRSNGGDGNLTEWYRSIIYELSMIYIKQVIF